MLKPPAEPARLPFLAAEMVWQRVLRMCLMECTTLLTDFLGHPWRLPATRPVDQHFVNFFPSCRIGSARTALFQEVRKASTDVLWLFEQGPCLASMKCSCLGRLLAIDSLRRL